MRLVFLVSFAGFLQNQNGDQFLQGTNIWGNQTIFLVRLFQQDQLIATSQRQSIITEVGLVKFCELP